MAARKKSPAENEPPPNFEDALGQLESIVHEMEEEQLPLEDLVARYEKGVKLLGQCRQVLDSAKQRLETIGSPAENPLTPDDEEDTDPSDDDPDDDIRLF
jgi:exodeoxyribonuclease VII small subunit